MIQDFYAFCLFLIISIFGWFISYSDFEELMVCYGCKKIEPVYDFVIVGGGTAGCVMARRLAENRSATVLVLEAGGRGNSILSIPVVGPMLLQSNFDWKYKTTKQTGSCLSYDGQKCNFPLGKILGGSHQINNMVYTRGHPEDYESWFQDLPNYSYEKDVEDYFKKAEQFYERNESIKKTDTPVLLSEINYFTEASSLILSLFQKLGYHLSESNLDFFGGFYRPLVTQKNGRRWTTSDHLLEMNFPNVDIVTKARADKIIFNDNLEASSIKFDYVGETLFVKARRAFILSAGTIGSAKLLMLSGIGPRDHLKKVGIEVLKDLPVGNNLQDHVTTGFDLTLVDSEKGTSILDILNPLSMYQYLFHSRGPWTSNGVDFIGFTNLDFVNCKNRFSNNITLCSEKYSGNQPDIEFLMLPYGITSDLGIRLRSIIGVSGFVWDNYYAKINQTAVGIMPILLHPKSRGTVRLANRNPKSKPLINPNYLMHPHDMKVLLSFVMKVKKIRDKKSRGRSAVRLHHLVYPGCEKHEFNTYCYWECYIRRSSTTSFHPVGTCKMGVSNDSVVDFDFQVIGTNKLFVVDGSVLPTEISGHPMGAIIMMAERAAEFLKRFYGFDTREKKSRCSNKNNV